MRQGAGTHVPGLDQKTLAQAVIRPGGRWREIRVVAETGSTNADLLQAARAGAAEGLVLVAGAQTAGRGRLGRTWVSLPGTALICSVLLRPAAPPAALGWVPLLAGVAVASALRAEAAVPAQLKWPNDVLVAGRKIAGILAEAYAGAIVVGIGVNVSLGRAELPVPTATSLRLEHAASTDREQLLAAILGELERWYTAWAGGAGTAGVRREYLRLSATIGRPVRAELPGSVLSGTAEDVDELGRLVLATGAGTEAVGAGDIVHLR